MIIRFLHTFWQQTFSTLSILSIDVVAFIARLWSEQIVDEQIEWLETVSIEWHILVECFNGFHKIHRFRCAQSSRCYLIWQRLRVLVRVHPSAVCVCLCACFCSHPVFVYTQTTFSVSLSRSLFPLDHLLWAECEEHFVDCGLITSGSNIYNFYSHSHFRNQHWTSAIASVT